MTTIEPGSDAHLGLEELTDEAAHLSSGQRDELCRRIHDLAAGDVDYDDELDFAEILANKNALA